MWRWVTWFRTEIHSDPARWLGQDATALVGGLEGGLEAVHPK